MANEETPTPSPDMSVDQLIKLLRVHSIAIAAHEKHIQQLREERDSLVAAQNSLRQNIESLRGLVEQIAEAIQPADAAGVTKGGLPN